MLLIFDLDGTLIDSSKDLALSVNATLQYAGLPPLPPNVIQTYVGNGAPALIRRALGPDASEELAAEALTYFLHYYRAHALEHTRLYPGIRDAVNALASEGHSLAILSNKPVKISTDIIRSLQLGSHFTHIYGGDSFPQKKPDPQGILAIQDEEGIYAGDTVMIGDSSVDVSTARNAGVRSCGVTWGFQPESLAAEPPDLLIHKTNELVQLPARLYSA